MIRTKARWFRLDRHGHEQDDQPAGLNYDDYVTPTGLDRDRLARDLAATMRAGETEPAEAGTTEAVDYRTADQATVDAEYARLGIHRNIR